MSYASDKKPGELTALTSLATDDVFIVGDTSDVSEVAKHITKANLITDLTTSFAPALGADDNYVTDAEKVKLSNLSGTNTGDQTNITGNAATVTTNANLTGHVTSVGNAAVLGSFTKAQLDTAVSDGNVLYVGDVTSNATHTGDATGSGALTVVALNGTNLAALGTGVLKNTTTTGVPFISKVALTEPATAATLTIANNQTLTVNGSATITNGTHSGTNTGDQTSIVGITGTMAQFDTAVSDGNIVYQSQALGTPASGTVTNLTGTASININGTVGATTPTTVVATTITANTGVIPDANDGAYLGTTTAQWSDLFLAEGGVINWDNGDATLTQTGNVLALAGADLQVATAGVGTNADSVPTLSSTSTLTNKTLTAPTLTGTTTADRFDYDRAVGLVNAIGNLGATETIDWSTHTHYTGTLDSNITFTYSNQVSGQSVTLYLSYDAAAQRTVTWPTTTWLDNATGAAPTTPSASGKVLVVTLVYIGTTTYGSATGNYAVYA